MPGCSRVSLENCMRYERRTLLKGSTLAGASVLGLPATVASRRAAADAENRVTGTVSYFGEPVEDAVVSLEGVDETTDEDGRYRVATDANEARLAVEASGYAEWSREIDFADDEAVTVNASLRRAWGDETGELRVYATEPEGGSGIPCRITAYGDEVYQADAPEGGIPDSGSWDRGLRVSEGWWEVRITDAAGYDDGYDEVYVEAGETELAWAKLEEGDATIPGTGRVFGRVVDEQTQPVENATVRIDGERVPVDDDGTFDVDREHGQHAVEAEAPGYRPLRGGVLVRFGRETELIVPLESE
ncbi:carboxypeptidase regulatory-like domain-containing protein [Natrialba sp. INN-245]|nr:carboxypeptidase regulatory-like domain-containing protein [Natrialba sp. INN-245]